MPEYLRSLVVVLVIATAVYAGLRRGFAPLMPPGAYQRRRNTFLALTVCAFLAPGFWFYALPAAMIVLLSARRESNIPALFIALLFAVPAAGAQMPGLGLVNFLLHLDHPRLLSLLLLLPLAVTLHRRGPAPGSRWPDRFFAAYLLLMAALLVARSTSMTNGLRGVVYLLIDMFLPYYVMSRAFTDAGKMKDALATFCVSGAVLAAVGIFEALKHWLLYRALLDHWSAYFGMGNYMLRQGLIRASATTGQPIVLGYVLMVAFACLLALRAELRSGLKTRLLFALLIAGLFSTFSRGPWLGAAVTAFAFWATANASRKRIGLVVGAMGVAALVVNLQMPSLSVVQSVDPGTIQYRSELLAKSMEVFGEHPWLGSDNYVDRLAAKGMLQGEGIVDVVNTYIGVALSTGAIGLALFIGLFTTVLWGVSSAKTRSEAVNVQGVQPGDADRQPGGPSELPSTAAFRPSLTARAIVASVLGIAVTIGTVSSISVIPWVYWAWLGTSVGFIRLAVRNRSDPAAPSSNTGRNRFSSISRQPARSS